jgi:hypothetical protein
MTTKAFLGTNPTDELITSGLPVIRELPGSLIAAGTVADEAAQLCSWRELISTLHAGVLGSARPRPLCSPACAAWDRMLSFVAPVV